MMREGSVAPSIEVERIRQSLLPLLSSCRAVVGMVHCGRSHPCLENMIDI